MKKFTFKHGVIITLCTSVLVFIISLVVSYNLECKRNENNYKSKLADGKHSPSWDVAETYIQSMLPLFCDVGMNPKCFGNELYREFVDSRYHWMFVGNDSFNDDGWYDLYMDITNREMVNYDLSIFHTSDIDVTVYEELEEDVKGTDVYNEDGELIYKWDEEWYQRILREAKDEGNKYREGLNGE